MSKEPVRERAATVDNCSAGDENKAGHNDGLAHEASGCVEDLGDGTDTADAPATTVAVEKTLRFREWTLCPLYDKCLLRKYLERARGNQQFDLPQLFGKEGGEVVRWNRPAWVKLHPPADGEKVEGSELDSDCGDSTM